MIEKYNNKEKKKNLNLKEEDSNYNTIRGRAKTEASLSHLMSKFNIKDKGKKAK